MEPKCDVAGATPTKGAAEEALQREEHAWERTFDSMPDLIAILDCDYRIVRVNRAMAEKIGCTAPQCIGLKCYETMWCRSASVTPAATARARK
jgi:PAS domain S-box-containing protein